MKKTTRFLIALLAVLAPGLLVAQGTWDQRADFGGGPRYTGTAVSTGDKAYMGLGVDESGYKIDFWAYDPVADTWEQRANFPGGVRNGATGFAINGIVYIGTGSYTPGDTGWIWYNDLWAYDPATNTWTPKATFGQLGRYGAVGFSINGKGYIGTGQYRRERWVPSSFYSDFWEYDPEADTWTRKADLPYTGRCWATGVPIGEKGYVGLGVYYYDTRQKDWWEFDPEANTWTRKTDLPGPPRYGAGGFTIGNRGYVGAGAYTSMLKDFYEYNAANDTWTRKVDYPVAQWMTCSFSIGCAGFMGTGQDLTSFRAQMYRYTPAPPITVSIPDVWAVDPGGTVNTTYIGYGPTSVALTPDVTGGIPYTDGSYTYLWNTGATTASVDAGSSTPGDFTYTVTATDQMGCSGSDSATIKVVDVRCGPNLAKVAVCKAPPDNPSNVHMICIPAAAVGGQLMDGSMLGECSGSVASEIEVYPNPSDGVINVKIDGLSAAVNIRIADRNGRMVRQRVVHPDGETITETFDLSDLPPGLYIVNIKNKNNVVVSKIFMR